MRQLVALGPPTQVLSQALDLERGRLLGEGTLELEEQEIDVAIGGVDSPFRSRRLAWFVRLFRAKGVAQQGDTRGLLMGAGPGLFSVLVKGFEFARSANLRGFLSVPVSGSGRYNFKNEADSSIFGGRRSFSPVESMAHTSYNSMVQFIFSVRILVFPDCVLNLSHCILTLFD